MTKRFVTEYANYKIRLFNSEPLMRKDIKEECKREIEYIVSLYKQGFITVDETMRAISEVPSLRREV